MSRNFIFSLLLGLLPLTGCGERRELSESALATRDSEYVVTILLDLSGSFAHQMAEEGKAYDFAMQLTDRYFRDRMGMNDQIIIAQISGEKRALLWQGTPQQLRQDFRSADEFCAFLHEKSDAAGSNVFEGIARTTEYMLGEPGVADGTAKSALFVLSDMLDNSSNADEARQRALTAMEQFSDRGGSIGLYYVDQDEVANWRRHLRTSGVRQCRVECDIVGHPPLPSFD